LTDPIGRRGEPDGEEEQEEQEGQEEAQEEEVVRGSDGSGS
jgi:hypothetical protein